MCFSVRNGVLKGSYDDLSMFFEGNKKVKI
jgi:hypothetical protein